jgi:hypothetical protein
MTGPWEAVLFRRRPPRQPEPEEHHGAGRDIGQVADHIAQQPGRAGQAAHAQAAADWEHDAQTAAEHLSVRKPPGTGGMSRPASQPHPFRIIVKNLILNGCG